MVPFDVDVRITRFVKFAGNGRFDIKAGKSGRFQFGACFVKEQTYSPVLGWKLSLVMGLITVSVLGGGLVARKWFQAAPPARSPARMRSLPMEETPPRVIDDANPPGRMPPVDDPSPMPRKVNPNK